MAVHRSEVPAPTLFEAMLHVVHDAVFFVQSGLQHGKGGVATASIQVLELALHKKISVAALGGGVNSADPKPRRTAAAWSAALTKALADLHDRCRAIRRQHFEEFELPVLGIALDDGVEAALARTGEAVIRVTPPADKLRKAQPLQHAYEMARFNRLQAEQRIVVLYALGDLLGTRIADEPGTAVAKAEIRGASDVLFAERGIQEMNQFSLAMLLGGDAQRECVERVRQKFGPNMSVMHLAAQGGVAPDFVPSQDVELMRRAIEHAQPLPCTPPQAPIRTPETAPAVKKEAAPRARAAVQGPQGRPPPFVSPTGFDF